MGNVVTLPMRQEPVKRARAARKSAKHPAKRTPVKRRQLLELLHAQATRALAGDWSFADELRELAYTARCASWKAKSITWRGVRFPLKHGLVIDSVRCPITDRALVGVIE